MCISVALDLGRLDPEHVQVELYADAANGHAAVRQPLTRGDRVSGLASGFVYTGRVATSRLPEDFTPRLVPHHPAPRFRSRRR